MNGNNSWQRMSPFATFPRRELGTIGQRQVLPAKQPGGLISMGNLIEGGGMPAPAMAPMPQQQIPRQQDYDEGRPPTGKKILGMPKDRFIALMGNIAQAFGGESVSGKMGAGLINMADIMREERIGKGEVQAAEAKAKREARKPKEKKYAGDIKAFSDIYGRAPSSAKELREFKKAVSVEKEKVPSAWEAFYREKKGEIDPETKFPYTAAKIHTAFKKTGEKEERVVRDKGFKEIDGVWYTGIWKEDQFTPRRPAAKAEIAKLTKAAPVTGEKIMTPDKAREKLFAIAKFKSSLSKTGGWNETVFELMTQKDPEFAKRALSISSSKEEVNTTIKELENYYEGIISGKPTVRAKEEEPFDIEEQDARDAINQGIPADRVREMYKRRTGKELGL